MRNYMPQTRFSFRIFRVLLLTVLATGLMVSPLRAVAQEAAPAASPAANASSSQTAKPAAANSDEEQSKAFRLEGPVIKATAKALHLSLETTASIYEVINFLIVLFGLGIPIGRWLPKYLRRRKEKLRGDLESARKVTEEASTRLSAIEAKLSGLDGEIARIRAQVEEESKQDEARIKSSIQEESARIVASAGQEMDAAAAQARRSLRNYAADLAIEKATQQLALTPETDGALIAEFLNGVAGNGAPKGGQN